MKRLLLLLCFPLLAVCSACRTALPSSNAISPKNEAMETSIYAEVKTTQPTVPTRPTVGEIGTVGVPTNAHAYSSEFKAGVPADMLFLNGEVWHATTLLTLIPPIGNYVTPCTVAIDRAKTPAAEGECNAVSLIGTHVWQNGDCLYTAEVMFDDADSPYHGTVYRQWQRGVATCAGPLFDGTNVLRFEGNMFRKVANVTENGDGSAAIGVLTLPTVPTEKGFVPAGRIVAIGSCAAQIDYGSTIGGLGRELYASAQFPHLLLAGNDTIGYWVLSSSSSIQEVNNADALWSDLSSGN